MKILKYFSFLEDKEKAHHLLLILIILFLVFTALVYFLPTSLLDIEFSEEVQEQNNSALDYIMKAISWFGKTPVALSVIFGTAFIFYISKYRREAYFTAATLAVSLVNAVIKVLVDRPRPSADLVNTVVEAQHQSFPSGHTSLYVTFFGFLIYLMLRLNKMSKTLRIPIIILSLFLTLTVPFSRVYLGAHWFTDVAGGFVLGLTVLYAIIHFYLKRRLLRDSE